jgi:undecaprenyl-diphosphatase
VPAVIASGVSALDVAAYRRIRGLARGRRQIAAAQSLSLLGEHAGVWLAIGAVGSAAGGTRRADWMRATASVAMAHALNVGVKRVVRRPRPLLEDLPALARTPSTLSFPSAHAASSFAAARAFGGLLPAPPLYAAALFMGASRVFLGVHYPLDVLVGGVLGIAVGSAGRPGAPPTP